MGGSQFRYTQVYESEYCEEGSIQAKFQQIQMIRTLADTPELQLCGYYPFQKMSMRHNGTNWVMELEATGNE